MRQPTIGGVCREGIEVLLLTDAVDEFWIRCWNLRGERQIATRAGADLDKIETDIEKDSVKMRISPEGKSTPLSQVQTYPNGK